MKIKLLVLLILGSLVATACTQATPTSTATLTLSYPTFEPSTISVAKGQRVKLTLTSADIAHTFTIDELGVNISVRGGRTVTQEFTAEEGGTLTFYCAVPGHRGAGMEGALEVAE